MTVEIMDDNGQAWRGTGAPYPKQITLDVYELLINCGEGRKITITEWADLDKKERLRKAQALRDAIEYRLARTNDERRVSISVRPDGMVWVGWRPQKEDAE